MKIISAAKFSKNNNKNWTSVPQPPHLQAEVHASCLFVIRHRICQIELAGSSHIPPHLTCLPIPRHVHTETGFALPYGKGGGERNIVPNEVDNKTSLVGPFCPGFADAGGRVAIIPFRPTERVAWKEPLGCFPNYFNKSQA